MQKGPPTPKGFRDIPPNLAKKRLEVIGRIELVLEENGFVPLETPTIEFAQTLKGKYGEEEKLIYEFKDRGGRDLALRYDLTVPLARYIATNNPPFPFRRYQIGQVFRGENPQAGRYREFTQFDFDTVGSDSPEEDAKIIATAIKAVKQLGLKMPVMLINDRKNFKDLPIGVTRALDKIHKIGESNVLKEILTSGIDKQKADEYMKSILEAKPTEDLKEIIRNIGNESLSENIKFDPTLARGLDYYTGSIFELKPTGDQKELSIGSGGRYDNLIGMFIYPDKGKVVKRVPAVGFSFGLDRLIESLS